MGMCKVCGNEYVHTFQVIQDGEAGTYDCFECAIHDMAPTCGHCHCRVIGHGVSAGGQIYCCAHCARAHDEAGQDHQRHPAPLI